MTDKGPRLRVIVQARASSDRLPRKVFLPIGGMPSILLCIGRAANAGAEVVLATSERPEDDQLSRLVADAGFQVVRGSLDDVLQRYVAASADLSDDAIVVRLTGDNVFPDGELIDEVVDCLAASQAEIAYIPWPEAGSPYGLSVEAFYAGALRASDQRAVEPQDREHVTMELKRSRPSIPCVPNVSFRDGGHARCTLDTPTDYDALRALLGEVDDPLRAPWRVLVEDLLASRSRHDPIPLRLRNGKVHSALSLGTAQLGMDYGFNNHAGAPSDARARTIVGDALDRGFLSIDTARSYGAAETLLGYSADRWRNGQVSIVTKLDATLGESTGQCRAAVDASVFRSCRELRVDTLDTLLIHRWSHRRICGGAVWERLRELQDEGVVRQIGASVQNPEEALEALDEEAVSHIQLPVNVLDRRWRDSAIPEALARRSEVTVHARSVFLQGVLLAAPEKWPSVEGVHPTSWVSRLASAASHFEMASVSELCIRYVLGLEWVDSLVVGFDTADQLHQVAALSMLEPLSRAEMAWVNERTAGAPVELLNPSLWPKKGQG